jgi:putative transposase
MAPNATLAVDALGLLLTVLVTAASVQDCDAARPLLFNLRRAFPTVKLAWAGGGYAGKLVTWAKTAAPAGGNRQTPR